MKEVIRQKRIQLLTEIDELQQGCKGCEVHYKHNKTKNITALTNACKECSLGQKLSQYGEKFLDLTKKSREKIYQKPNKVLTQE